MRLAPMLPGELIRCAFVWHDPGITPCCKSRRAGSAKWKFEIIESGPSVLLNRCCVFTPDLESMFPAEMLKRLLQHNRGHCGHEFLRQGRDVPFAEPRQPMADYMAWLSPGTHFIRVGSQRRFGKLRRGRT